MDLASQVTEITEVEPEKPKTDLERAIEYYYLGWSYSQIGNEFGWNRNQVAGKLSRAGVLRQRHKGNRSKKDAKTHPAPSKPIPNAPFRPLPLTTARVIPMRQPEPVKERIRVRLIDNDKEVTLMQLEPHMCKWPIGDPKRPDFRFCGCNRDGVKPYCAEHVRLAGQQPFSQRRA